VDNLLVIDRGQHMKLHAWIDRGAPIGETVTTAKQSKDTKECKSCGNAFFSDNKNTVHCSLSCAGLSRRQAERPTKEELEVLVWTIPTIQVAKRYLVSDRCIGKWCDSYGIVKPGRGYWAKLAAEQVKEKDI